jgi:hypothetical protein
MLKARQSRTLLVDLPGCRFGQEWSDCCSYHLWSLFLGESGNSQPLQVGQNGRGSLARLSQFLESKPIETMMLQQLFSLLRNHGRTQSVCESRARAECRWQ